MFYFHDLGHETSRSVGRLQSVDQLCILGLDLQLFSHDICLFLNVCQLNFQPCHQLLQDFHPHDRCVPLQLQSLDQLCILGLDLQLFSHGLCLFLDVCQLNFQPCHQMLQDFHPHYRCVPLQWIQLVEGIPHPGECLSHIPGSYCTGTTVFVKEAQLK